MTLSGLALECSTSAWYRTPGPPGPKKDAWARELELCGHPDGRKSQEEEAHGDHWWEDLDTYLHRPTAIETEALSLSLPGKEVLNFNERLVFGGQCQYPIPGAETYMIKMVDRKVGGDTIILLTAPGLRKWTFERFWQRTLEVLADGWYVCDIGVDAEGDDLGL